MRSNSSHTGIGILCVIVSPPFVDSFVALYQQLTSLYVFFLYYLDWILCNSSLQLLLRNTVSVCILLYESCFLELRNIHCSGTFHFYCILPHIRVIFLFFRCFWIWKYSLSLFPFHALNLFDKLEYIWSKLPYCPGMLKLKPACVRSGTQQHRITKRTCHNYSK